MILNMVNSCAAYNCTERYRKGGVAFHSFPASKELRNEWIKALRRSNFTPNRYSKLCAKHFTPDCYETAPWSYMKRLKEGAVPTVFEFTQKRKYQKKSLDDSPVRSEDRKHGAMSQNFVAVPVSPSPGRRKQLIIERKEFNTSDADPSESHLVKFPSKLTEQSVEIVETENSSSLPSKRCRKKKTFSNDFVSADFTSKRRGRANKLGKGDEEVLEKHLSVKLGKLGVTKEMTILESEKESAPQNAPSGMFSASKNNNSSVEICEDVETSSINGRVSTNVECGSAEKIILNEAMNGSNGVILKTISCAIPFESTMKEIQSECNKVSIKSLEKNILVESAGAQGIFLQQSAVSDVKGLEIGTVNIEDFFKASNNVINVNENSQRNTVSELIVDAAALRDISTSQEHITMMDANGGVVVANNIDNCDTSSKNVATSSTSTSNQGDSSILKLNLEEEEAMLQRCKQLGEAAQRKKLVRLKKVISGSGRKPVSGNQVLKTSSTASDVLQNSKRKTYFGDFKQEDLVSPERAAKCLKVAEKVIKEKTLKIKFLKQRERRLMQKVTELENVIFHLVEKRMNPEEASTVLIVLKEND